MKRSLASFAVVALFSVLLVGTSKAPPSASSDASAAPSAPPPPSSSTSPTAATTDAAIPSTAGWPRQTAKTLGATYAAPPGTKVVYGGQLLVVVQLPSGAHASLQFDQGPGSAASFVKDDLKTATEGKEKGTTILLSEPDAFMYRAHDRGLWCEAAKKVGDRVFRGSAGALYEGKPEPIREGDCMTLIAIVRSIAAAP